jgi:hypothetical protein
MAFTQQGKQSKPNFPLLADNDLLDIRGDPIRN